MVKNPREKWGGVGGCEDAMTILLSTMWTLLVILAVMSAIQARYLGRGMNENHVHDQFEAYRPFVSVVVPFKGVEHDGSLADHVRALCEQDYGNTCDEGDEGNTKPQAAGDVGRVDANDVSHTDEKTFQKTKGNAGENVGGGGYRLLLVVDSVDDPAYGVIASVLEEYPNRDARLLVSGQADDNEGQKIHNQLFAIEQLERDSEDDHVWVFADSDAVPNEKWLGKMVGPLVLSDTVAMTTGYRYLTPMKRAKKTQADRGEKRGGEERAGERAGESGGATLASVIGCIANSSVVSLYARQYFTQAWGGSMALTVATARAGRLQSYLRGALTDDYQFTRMCGDMGKRVYYVRQCLIASPVDFDWKSLVNFAHRQYLITRVYRPWIYTAAVALTGVYVWGWWSAVLHAGHYLYHEPASMRWIPSVIVLAIVHGFNQWRSYFRRRTLRWTLGESLVDQWRVTWAWDRWGTIVWMTVHHLLILRSLIGNTMQWRGIRYRLRGPQDVQRLQG